MVRDIHYFAYGTLQQGLSNYADMTDVLGEPVGRFRTVEPFAVVVPHERGCSNPGCNLLHRMATLVSAVGSLRAEGDVYLVDAGGLGVIDRLVRLPRSLVPSLAGVLPVAVEHDTADDRIGACCPEPAAGKHDGPPHRLDLAFAGHHTAGVDAAVYASRNSRVMGRAMEQARGAMAVAVIAPPRSIRAI